MRRVQDAVRLRLENVSGDRIRIVVAPDGDRLRPRVGAHHPAHKRVLIGARDAPIVEEEGEMALLDDVVGEAPRGRVLERWVWRERVAVHVEARVDLGHGARCIHVVLVDVPRRIERREARHDREGVEDERCARWQPLERHRVQHGRDGQDVRHEPLLRRGVEEHDATEIGVHAVGQKLVERRKRRLGHVHDIGQPAEVLRSKKEIDTGRCAKVTIGEARARQRGEARSARRRADVDDGWPLRRHGDDT